ncbi:hypothetical protein AAY473_017002 [Plecturocebus cupreus]
MQGHQCTLSGAQFELTQICFLLAGSMYAFEKTTEFPPQQALSGHQPDHAGGAGDGVSLCRQAGVQWNNLERLCHLHFPGSNNSSSASQVAGTIGICHHTQLIFVFSMETRFRHVGQNGIAMPNAVACDTGGMDTM